MQGYVLLLFSTFLSFLCLFLFFQNLNNNCLSLENAGKCLSYTQELGKAPYNPKGHHSSICSMFKDIFVHPNDFFSGKFLHESCITLIYLSKTTFITQFGCHQTKLCPKYENCSKLKSCNALKRHKGDESAHLDESAQMASVMSCPWCNESSQYQFNFLLLLKLHTSFQQVQSPFNASIEPKNIHKT